MVINKIIPLAESIANRKYIGAIECNTNIELDLMFDSIKILRLMIGIEQAFDFNFSDTDIDISECPTILKIAEIIVNNKKEVI